MTGLCLNLWLVHEWYRLNFGPLDVQVTLRNALWGFTAIVFGVQTIFGSFFLSMLGMKGNPGGNFVRHCPKTSIPH